MTRLNVSGLLNFLNVYLASDVQTKSGQKITLLTSE